MTKYIRFSQFKTFILNNQVQNKVNWIDLKSMYNRIRLTT